MFASAHTPAPVPSAAELTPLTVEEKEDALRVEGDNFALELDKRTGCGHAFSPGSGVNSRRRCRFGDRLESTRVGVYGGTVAEQHVPSIRPQENGHKTDVRWATVTNLRGMGLFVPGMPVVNVTVHDYTSEDLVRARHDHELVRRPVTALDLDLRHGGLGSNSCGPGPLPIYQLQPEEMRLQVRLRPFAGDIWTPPNLVRQQLEVIEPTRHRGGGLRLTWLLKRA